MGARKVKEKYVAEKYFKDKLMGFSAKDKADTYRYTRAVVSYSWRRRGKTPKIPFRHIGNVKKLAYWCRKAGIRDLSKASKQQIDKAFKNTPILLPPYKPRAVRILTPKPLKKKITYRYKFAMDRRTYTIETTKKLKTGQMSYRYTQFARQIYDMLLKRDKSLTAVTVGGKRHLAKSKAFNNFRTQYLKYFPQTVAGGKKKIKVSRIAKL